jgi:hypothetical protein
MVAPAIINPKDGGIYYDMDAPLPAGTDASLTSAPAAHTAAVVTIAADPVRQIYVRRIHWGFSGGTPASTLQIAAGSGPTVVWGPIPVGTAVLNFIDVGLVFPVNQQVVVTLSDPGVGITGAVTVDAYLMQ